MTRRRSGFSLLEALIALTVGLVVVTVATDAAARIWKGRRGWMAREGVDRGARFVGLSLRRDLAVAGTGLESSAAFASVGTAGDTLTILSVPLLSFPGLTAREAPTYPLFNDGGAGPTYPPGGTCGTACLDLLHAGQPMNMRRGDVLQLRVGTTRRLLLVTNVWPISAARFRVTFLNVPSLAGRPSGLASLPLLRGATSVQQVLAVTYWRDDATRQLLRADSYHLGTGRPTGVPVAPDVSGFTARLRFVGGGERPTYDAADADTTNDGNDILGVVVRAEMQADRTDPAVNGGRPLRKWYAWRVAPRNLLFEKNR